MTSQSYGHSPSSALSGAYLFPFADALEELRFGQQLSSFEWGSSYIITSLGVVLAILLY